MLDTNKPNMSLNSHEPSATPKSPAWPKKALITAGMPYGNKGLHFGHIGGVFVPADVFARFLRDRIGEQNVLFISGTDCYGSPIDEGFRKLKEDGLIQGNIEDFVEGNHRAQANTLERYAISLDIFEGSGIGESKQIHEHMTAEVIKRLYASGFLDAISTAQFYDEKAQIFLNGRQVLGRCPVQGCNSEKAYADECDLGHQYMPEDLIAPISNVTGEVPVMRKVSNWYFDLPRFHNLLEEYVRSRETQGETRAVVLKTIEEFLEAPIIYVKNECQSAYEHLIPVLPPHEYRVAEKGKASFELEFSDVALRERARDALVEDGIRFRTGKTLVPFRITGNIKWGVAAPELEDTRGLTVWCWPESLWAPISFTKARLKAGAQRVETLNPGRDDSLPDTWENYWCDPDARIYQFIGQDNIYFYGVAQTALWSALATSGSDAAQDCEDAPLSIISEYVDTAPPLDPPHGQIQQSQLIANYHLQFLGKKASSSGAVRPPMADELLDYYTSEQLRAHFLALGLGQRPVSFQPKPLDPAAQTTDGDPVQKEGSLLTNVLNRLARSCFYSAHNDTGGIMPLVKPDEELVKDVQATLLEYERIMYLQEFHNIMHLADGFIRRANKYWADNSKLSADDPALRRTVLGNSFYLLKAACLMMHPVAPSGARMVFEYLDLDVTEREFFSWEHAYTGFDAFIPEDEKAVGGHLVKELPPRTDFFPRHPSQFQ